MMKNSSLLLAGALALAAWPAASALAGDAGTAERAGKAAPTYAAAIGEPAPDFELQTTDGGRWKLSDQRGKVVVLEWFNPQCPFVVKAHAEGGALQTLGNRATNEGVAWVAINSAHRGHETAAADVNAKAREQFGMKYPVLLDETSWVGAAYGAKTTPHMFVIDAKGLLVYVGAPAERDTNQNLIEPVLAALKAGQPIADPRTESYGCGVKYPDHAELGLEAPAFELKGLDGNAVDLASYRGKITVLEWFNPECPVVNKAHDAGGPLDGLAARWADKGVAWIAINSGGAGQQGTGVDKNQRAKAKWSLAYPILLDGDGKVGKAYGATTTPHMFILDERGVLVYRGGHADREGTNLVDQALADLTSGKKISQPDTKNFGCSVKYAN